MNGIPVEERSLKTEIDVLHEQVKTANERIDAILDFSFGPAPVQEVKTGLPMENKIFVLSNEIGNINSKMGELNEKLCLIIERFGC